MKKKNLKNSNGIAICDSIVMSVKKKRPNFRVAEAVFIAVCGFVATIMSFFSMFDINYNRPAVVFSAILFSAVYITLALMGKRGIWISAGSIFIAILICVKHIEKLALGFKFIYNRIYSAAYHTDISYYKNLKPALESSASTAFIILYIWALAQILYIFTIYRPNSIPPLLITFPVLEVGLYNGMAVSILWGMLLVGYWFALFAMTTIDIGEYSGGSGGFVRKENLFFPKRQMRLKVTEKCGVILLAEVLVITAVTAGGMKLFGYKRSEQLNIKRSDVRDAVNSFSMDDITGSVSNITSAFGITFTYDTHKLGNVDKLRYKDTTDLKVTIDKEFDGAIYLKDYTGAVYDSDRWTGLPDSAYHDPLFSDFKAYSIYPQDFPNTFDKLMFKPPNHEDYTIQIESKRRNNRSFAPYGTDTLGILQYNLDKDVTSKKNSSKEYSYRFRPYEPDDVAQNLVGLGRTVYFPKMVDDPDWRKSISDYCYERGLISDGRDYITIDWNTGLTPDLMYSHPDGFLAMVLEMQYEDFVYDNYLALPENSDMEEVRKAFAPLLGKGTERLSASAELQILDALREKVNGMVEYSLTPGRTPNNRDFVNYFLFENHKGYCTHYASAGVVLARMAGIPARYATGYVLVGDDFNEDNRNASGSYTIDVKDNRSHAWVEIYLNGYGWVPYEFTAGYSQQSIDTTPTTSAETTEASAETTTTAVEEETTFTETTESRSAPSNTNSGGSTTAAATTSLASTSSTGGSGYRNGGGNGFHITISPTVKYTFYTILLMAAFIGAILLRRVLILKLRHKRISEGDTKKRMKYIYGYAEKLLGIAGITRGNESRMDFAAKVDKMLGGKLYPEGGFTSCTDAALRAAFSEITPDKSEADVHMRFAEEFAKKLYAESKPLRRLVLRFVNVIQ